MALQVLVIASHDAEGASASGKTYYVDPTSGSDTNNGTSASTPWKTLDKMLGGSYSGGDRILLKKGAKFTISSAKTIKFSGSKGNFVELSSYGSGAKPIIDGGSYATTFIQVKGQYLDVNGIVVQNMGKYGLIFENTAYKGLYGYRLSDLEFYNLGQHAIFFTEYQGVHDVVVKNVKVLNVGGAAVAILGNANDHSSDIDIGHMDIDTTRNDDSITIHEGSSNPLKYAGTNISIHDCVIRNSGEDGIDLTTGSYVKVYRNIIMSSKHIGIMTDHSFHHGEIYENRIINNGAPSALAYIATPHTQFYRNELAGTGKSKYVLYVADANANPGVGVTNVSVFANTFIENGEFGNAIVRILDTNGKMDKLYFYDNVISTRKTTLKTVMSFGSSTFKAADGGFYCDGNVYGPGTFTVIDYGGSSISWASWQSTYGRDKNGLSTDPLLVGRTSGNHNLSSDSPCIDKAMSAYSSKLVGDVMGRSVYGNSDAGAFESNPTLSIGKDAIVLGSKVKVYADGKYVYSSKGSSSTSPVFSVRPTSGWSAPSGRIPFLQELSIEYWNTTNDLAKTVRESYAGTPPNSTYSFGGLTGGAAYQIEVSGKMHSVRTAGSDGTLTFALDLAAKDRSIRVKPYVPPAAKIYYVDPAGSDSNTGTAQNLPLKTLDKAFSLTLKSGEKVLLKRGSTWSIAGAKTIPFSGTKGSPVTLGNYGSGALPAIDGGTTLGSTLFVSGQYLNINGIAIRNMAGNGITIENAAGSPQSGILFEGLVVYNVRGDGIAFTSKQSVSDVKVLNCTVSTASGSGIVLKGTLTSHSSGIEIAGCVIDATGSDGIFLDQGGSETGRYIGSGITIRDNVVRQSSKSGIGLTSGSSAKVFRNTVKTSSYIAIRCEYSFRDAEIYANRVTDASCTSCLVYISTPDTAFYRNEISGQGKAKYVLYLENYNGNAGVVVKNVSIYANTIVWNGERGISIVRINDNNGNMGDVYFYDNIVSTKQTALPAPVSFGFTTFLANDPAFHCDGNVYGPGTVQFRNGSTVLTLAQWRSAGNDKNGLSGDPGFTARTSGNYNLTKTSACIDHVVFSKSKKITVDIWGNKVSGTAPDSGASEYKA